MSEAAAETTEPTTAPNGALAEEAKPARRGPLSFVEKLEQMHKQKSAQLDRVLIRERAQEAELSRTRQQRELVERELEGLDRVLGETRVSG